MAEPSTSENQGMTPTDEGQEPEQGQERRPDGEPKEPRTYPETYVKQLRKEAADSRKQLAELTERVEEFESRDKSELERLAETAAKAEKRAQDAKTRLLRYEVAAERGLGMEAAAFLSGSTREELEHRADELSRLLQTSSQKPTVGYDGGARPLVPDDPGTAEEQHAKLLQDALRGGGRGRF